MSEELAELKKNPLPPIEEADALIEGGVPESQFAGIHDCHVMIRGRYDRQQELVPRGFPRLLAGDDQPKITQGSGRVELARWVGIARQSDDRQGDGQSPLAAPFRRGDRPHAQQFRQARRAAHASGTARLSRPPVRRSGWSIKAMQKMIMLSAAYQQSSVPDARRWQPIPDNELFGRMNRQRLEAEPFRDALLAVSGSLDETMGGAGVPRAERPATDALSDDDPLGSQRFPHALRRRRPNWDRGPTKRFDRRPAGAVPDEQPVRAGSSQSAGGSRDERRAGRTIGPRIDWLYRLLYSRPATDRETEIGMSVVRDGGESWQQYCQVLLCANEFVYVD